ncbi:MAG: hypothetical protein ACFB8W_24505 [Elainellaceae cyanobacterium]
MLFFLGRLHPRSGRHPLSSKGLRSIDSDRHCADGQSGDSRPSNCFDELSNERAVQEALRQQHRRLEANYFLERSPLR